MVELGKYRHYKGGEYEVVLNALMENNQEPVVVYGTLYENEKSEYWVRTEKDFLSMVEANGEMIPRFNRVD